MCGFKRHLFKGKLLSLKSNVHLSFIHSHKHQNFINHKLQVRINHTQMKDTIPAFNKFLVEEKSHLYNQIITSLFPEVGEPMV